MDDAVLASIARWPDVPHIYGWLSLDRRGRWRLQGSPITNPHISEFIGRNYAADQRGAWFFQNGPQRVFVQLDCTPWALRLGSDRQLLTHTGEAVEKLLAAVLDDAGNLLLAFARGVGVVDDRDLPTLLECIADGNGKTADEQMLGDLMQGRNLSIFLYWHDQVVPVKTLHAAEVPQHFGFVATPQPD